MVAVKKHTSVSISARFFSAASRGGLRKTTDDASQKIANEPQKLVAADITDDQYHRLADAYLDEILAKFEDVQDTRTDLDVEYSVRICLGPGT